MQGALRFTGALLATLLCSAALAAPAWAHGGRFARPGGTFRPRPPLITRPPGTHPRPVTRPPGTPGATTPTTVPGSGVPTTTGPLPDTYWGSWWALNRWTYLPERGAALWKRRVTTGADDPSRRGQRAREKRALLARQLIKPFLLKQLDSTGSKLAPVRAAALLALAKISADDETLERILKVAEGQGPTWLERESAALAVGLLRRTAPEARLAPSSLDRARVRLLTLIGNHQRRERTRCFAAFSLGLLADQGYGSAFSAEGRLVIKGLIDHLENARGGPELPVALLTALSLQPRAGIPSTLFENLSAATAGSKTYGRRWSPLERAHALSTYARLRGPGWAPMLLRLLSGRRLPAPVMRTARLALGSEARRLSAAERLQAVEALIAAGRSSSDPLGEGLSQIALGRIVNAELKESRVAVLTQTKAARLLLRGAAKAPVRVRGFHVLALGLAARDLDLEGESEEIQKFVKAARKAMLTGFDRPRGDKELESAYVIGIGLLHLTEAKDRLVDVLRDRNAGPALGSRSAIALAVLEAADEKVLKALQAVTADPRPLAPRSAAALALSILTGEPASDMLGLQLREAKSLREQAAAARAIGQLGDPKALSVIIQIAHKGEHSEELRALAVSVLGLLGDPEQHPSLFRLSLDANYIARTDALNEAFTLL